MSPIQLNACCYQSKMYIIRDSSILKSDDTSNDKDRNITNFTTPRNSFFTGYKCQLRSNAFIVPSLLQTWLKTDI